MRTSFSHKRQGILILLILVSLTGSWLLAMDLDRRQPKDTLKEEDYLIPGDRLQPLLMGYDLIVADFFWLETVQYLGKHLLTDRQFPFLYPRLLRVVTLDPHFIEVYRLGGIFLAYSADQVDEALSLLERGVFSNEGRWELPHDLGVIHYLRKKDYSQALHWLERANRLPGRPDYVPRFIARLYAATGEQETSIEMWTRIHEQTSLSWVRDIARRELYKLGVHLPPEAEP